MTTEQEPFETDPPFPPCDESRDGDEHVTLERGRFVCRHHPELGWVWQTVPGEWE